MPDPGEAGTVRLPLGELQALVGEALGRAGLAPASVPFVAAVLVAAERDGVRSHGLLRLPGYLNTLRTGWADGAAEPRIVEEADALLVVDAGNGFAQVALAAARPRLVEMAAARGVATLLIRDSHHFAALWPDIEDLCAEGFVALTCTNSKKRMAAWDGRARVLGTNAMAFGCPRAGGLPFVWDQASSVMSQGDMLLAAAEDREVGPGIGLDAAGEPTRSPAAILDGGALLPFGGHKGAALAATVEILAAALTGSRFGWEDASGAVPGVTTSRGGQFLLLIDPRRAGATDFAARVEALIGSLRQAGSARLPGDKRYAHRRLSLAEGVLLPAADVARLRAQAAGQDISPSG